MQSDMVYEEVDGMIYPIVTRKKGESRIDECPFCGERHIHSSGEGHRYPRCRQTGVVSIADSIVSPQRGYILREY